MSLRLCPHPPITSVEVMEEESVSFLLGAFLQAEGGRATEDSLSLKREGEEPLGLFVTSVSGVSGLRWRNPRFSDAPSSAGRYHHVSNCPWSERAHSEP